MPFEVTTLRRDVETFGRHATVAFTANWEEDARRRDFTLNALYAGSDGTVFDPLGGYDDLAAGRVRFIGDAEARINEDYLRILRFFRFNAYYGKGPLDQEGLQACVRLRGGLEQLSAERIAAELRRLSWRLARAAPSRLCSITGCSRESLAACRVLMRFERLVAIETRRACARRRAAARRACRVRAGGRRALAARLRLSNAEQAMLALGAADHAG